MLTDRQLLILRLIIQLYTETLEPVGSKKLMETADLPYSSATIRNEMMKLEELGYLEKYHKSSGRVPSNKGYRFFLDYILPQEPAEVLPQTQARIRSKLQNPMYEMQELFHMSADILATLTNYTCISVGPELSSSRLIGFRLVRLSDTQVMAILVTDKEYVENKVFSIPAQVSEDDLERIVKIMNEELVGLPLSQVILRLKKDIPLLMKKYMESQIMIVNAINEMVNHFEKDRLHVAGKRHLLNYIDSHSDVEQLKDVYRLMEDSDILHQLVTTDTKDIQIRLGYEMNNPLLEEFSLITASYDTPTNDKGVIALLGPVNMPYQKVISIVDSLRNELSLSMNQYYERQR